MENSRKNPGWLKKYKQNDINSWQYGCGGHRLAGVAQ